MFCTSCRPPHTLPPQSQLVCLHVEALDVLDGTNMHAACFAQSCFFLTTYYGVTTATFSALGVEFGTITQPPAPTLLSLFVYSPSLNINVFDSNRWILVLCLSAQPQTAAKHSSRLYEQRNRSLARKIRYSLEIGIKLFLNKLFIYFVLLPKIETLQIQQSEMTIKQKQRNENKKRKPISLNLMKVGGGVKPSLSFILLCLLIKWHEKRSNVIVVQDLRCWVF